MAIRKKEEQKSIPAKLQALLTRAFGEQFLTKKFDDKFKETKAGIEDYLINNTDDFSIDTGKATTCAEGTFNYVERTNIKVDTNEIIKLVEKKKFTLAQILACVSTFKNEDLEKVLSTEVFNKIVTKSSSSSLTLKASAEYKASMDADFEGGFKKEEEIAEVKKVIKEIKPAKEVVAKSKTPKAEDQLDAILKSR